MINILYPIVKDPPKLSAILVDDGIMEALKDLFDEKIISFVSTFYQRTSHEIIYEENDGRKRGMVFGHGDYIVKKSYTNKPSEYVVVGKDEFNDTFSVDGQILEAKDILGGSIVFNNASTITIEEAVINQIRDAVLDGLVTWVKK